MLLAIVEIAEPGISVGLKDAGVTGKSVRVAPQSFLNLQRQSVHAPTHVGPANREPDTDTRGNRDHRRSRTSSTSRSAEVLTPLPTRTR
jgi:hypothetical protein